MMRFDLKLFVLVVSFIALGRCDSMAASQGHGTPPAEVTNAVKEKDLTTIRLTKQAEIRLGIETTMAEIRTMEKTRTWGGEVVAVPGHSATLTATLAGTLLALEDGSAITGGQHVTKGQPLGRLLLALQATDLFGVQAEVKLREVELDLAQSQQNRARQLLDDKAGSQRQWEEAKAQLARAQGALDVAHARLALLEMGEDAMAGEGLPALLIRSPLDGIVQALHVAPGQSVTGGTALMEITDLNPIWIKVPVYVGDLDAVDSPKAARVHSLADFAGTQTQTAKPVVAPLRADPQAATADLYYEITNPAHTYRPGQKVGVTLMLKGSEQNLVVPYSSILYDMYGSTWVYINTEPQVYVRQRVALRHVLGEFAILSRGPAMGTKVVKAGAAELFGTEFGVGK
ncbi:efflux RND transporter periplasmic adaptor subunit [Planctomycetota bacterium]